MFLTGFADEAGKTIDVQIKATRKLGWHFIESRAIGDKNLATLTDAEFDDLSRKLDENHIKINCYGSSIANWAKSPESEKDFNASCDELLAAIPRMKKLNIPMLRGMSFANLTDKKPDSAAVERIIFKKLRHLVGICADNGIIYGHENCMNYGGLSYLHTLKMLEKVNNDALKLIFDTGNPVFNYRVIGKPPYPLQSAWEFYKNVREFIVYVHIKDATALPRIDGVRPTPFFTYPGDGCGDIRAIIRDLHDSNYDGGFSIEPHIASVFHDKSPELPPEKAQEMFDSYVEYGRRFEKILTEAGYQL